MARFIVYSFFFIVLINAFSINEVQATTKSRHRREDIGDWFNRQKESWFNWGNDKLDELKKAAAAVPLQLEKRYEEMKRELAVKTAELESLPLYQDIQRLELALLSDEAGVQHFKETAGANLGSLGDSASDKLDSLRTVIQREKVAEAAEDIVNPANNKLDDLRNNPLWKSLQAENEKKSEEDNEDEKEADLKQE